MDFSDWTWYEIVGAAILFVVVFIVGNWVNDKAYKSRWKN
ncbi:Putative protein [Zobellia galactanivorans]|uniref:Uncharacterized protein n=1 Tax=Zobellia galactanivorans (strain DSM 12802 / CCUG 47099 / CIP 106680 / NCIMB 13871 / Dsij) TaxID=63186 RepID=G0L6Y0_ZOBGA|nr:Putative protein [Zobellia galactanivorans]